MKTKMIIACIVTVLSLLISNNAAIALAKEDDMETNMFHMENESEEYIGTISDVLLVEQLCQVHIDMILEHITFKQARAIVIM